MTKRTYSKSFELMVEERLFFAICKRILSTFEGNGKKPISLILYIARVLDRPIAYFARKLLTRNVSVDRQTVIFIPYQGTYACNPRAIADELLRRRLPYRLIWTTTKEVDYSLYPQGLEIVKRGTFRFYEALAQAKIIIENSQMLERKKTSKRSGQILIQTWHGSLGIKFLDGRMNPNNKGNQLVRRCSRETDFCISNSTFETDVYHTSYWPGVSILQYGHPRNDIFLSNSDNQHMQIESNVRCFLNIPPDTRIALYAPTHNDREHEHLFQLDYAGVRRALTKRFGGMWIIAVRLHSRLQKFEDRWLMDVPPFVYNVTQYADIQDLMIAAEVGFTDYSSWIFDFLLLKRPGFIVADEEAIYTEKRSFYYPLESTPFPISRDSSELIRNIENFDQEAYLLKVAEFLEEKGCIEDGHASERVVDKIRELTR